MSTEPRSEHEDAVEAAWEALTAALPGDDDPNAPTPDVIVARHRPLIEAAILDREADA